MAIKETELIYPESDGQPMADNTLQFRWIVTIEGGLDALFADRPDVFVAGDLLWYPVEGRPDIRAAPDALVAFGRPKGDRGSYLQWREGGVAPQVVFEVMSPGNRPSDLIRKFLFYRQYGVREYYLYDPDSGDLSGWQRQGEELVDIAQMDGWISPLLGVRFEREGADLALFGPDGRRFASYIEVVAARNQAEERADQAEERAGQAEERADQAEERADQAEERSRRERERSERLAERLRELGADPNGL